MKKMTDFEYRKVLRENLKWFSVGIVMVAILYSLIFILYLRIYFLALNFYVSFFIFYLFFSFSFCIPKSIHCEGVD